jgi:hypothetical protein
MESIFYAKACRLYDALTADSHEESLDDLPVTVFRGGVMDLYKNVRPKLSMSDYARLFRGLKQTGSITQIQKGARNTDTVISLHHRPTAEQWTAYERSPLTQRMEYGTLKEQLLEVKKEVEALRTRINHLESGPPASVAKKL